MKQRVQFLCLFTAFFCAWNASAQPTVLSPSNAVYRFLDDGSNQGTAWRSANFNDASWPTGAAPFGYGMTSITTTTATGRVTYYYRRTFTDGGPTLYSNLVVRLRRDDGGIVYLNGVEIFRSNMPTGLVDSTTLAAASVAGAAQFAYFSNNVSPSVLIAGVNQLAVEIHEATANNADAAFDLELLGFRVSCTYTLNLGPGFSAIANQCDRGGNHLSEILPVVPDGSVIQKYINASGTFITATYDAAFGGWDNDLVLNPGEGAFISLPVSASLTFSGATHTPVLPVNIPNNTCWMLSRQTALPGDWTTIVGTTPQNCSQVNKWNYTGQGYDTFTFLGGTWIPSTPTFAIGESAFFCTPPPPPTITCPQSVTTNVCNTNAVVSYPSPAVIGGALRACLPASGSVFPLGTNIVTCTATNCAGTNNCSFSVIVRQIPAVTITCPSSITTNICGSSVVINYSNPAVTNGGLLKCAPASGSIFSTGVTPVNCVATNACGSNACTFNVTVQQIATVTITCSTNITTNTCGNSVVVNYPGPAVTNGGFRNCAPASGSVFTNGVTPVTCTATNVCGTNTCTFTVSVQPMPAITITCPTNITTNTCGSSVAVSYPPPTVANGTLRNCNPASGSTFPLGTNLVTCIGTNSCGSNTCTFTVTVQQTPPPSITAQPQSQTACVGSSVTVCVTASGAAPLSYSWRKNGAAIPGASGNCYTIVNAQVSDNGAYNVVVSSACGQTNSASATVTITDCGPVITGISPTTAGMGDLITITGLGFDLERDNLCVVLRNGARNIPLRVVQASSTQLTALVGPVPPDAQPGPIMLARGQGAEAGFVDVKTCPTCPLIRVPAIGSSGEEGVPVELRSLSLRPEEPSTAPLGAGDGPSVELPSQPTLGWDPLQPIWTFNATGASTISTQQVALIPTPAPAKGTNWIFSEPAANGGVSFVISNDCPALTKVQIQGDLSVITPNGAGLDIIIPNLVLKARLSAAGCAQAICNLLVGAYAQVGITINCVVTPLGGNAARISITVPGGSISAAGVTICFSPAEANRATPFISGIEPLEVKPGDLITITGGNFGNNPDNLCLQIMNPGRTIPLRALEVTDDQIVAQVGSVPPDSMPGPVGLSLGLGNPQSITDSNNIIVSPQPAWVFASTQTGIASAQLVTPIPVDQPPPPPHGQPLKKKYFSNTIDSNGVICVYVDPNCAPVTKITIEAHFNLVDSNPNDGIDCPITHIDSYLNGSLGQSAIFGGTGTDGNCIDFVCQFFTQIFYNSYNSLFGPCYGYPLNCTADLTTGKITITAAPECGCKLINGGVTIEYCEPQGPATAPVITDIQPTTFQSGQTVQITGSGFGNNPDDICLVLVNSNRLVPLRALSATDTLLTAEVGPIPPNATAGRIGLAVGDGSTGLFQPAFGDLLPQPAWFFATPNPGTLSPVTVNPTYVPPVNQTWYHSFLSNGQVYVFLPGPCPPGTKLIMDGHFDLRSTNSPITHADCWLPAVNYLQGGSALDCARRICDSFVCGFLQRTGVRLSCRIIPQGNGALICLGYPSGTIVNGGMTVCTRICDQPPVAQCFTNTVYLFAHGTTNDNFAGPEAASPRPELITWLNSIGISTNRGYDDAVSPNRVFVDSFANLPDCITKATLRIRLRANPDIPVNDAIMLAFAGPGGVLDPVRWSGYIGTGNPGPGVAGVPWVNGTIAEVVLDLSRLPLGNNQFRDLIPTLCNKKYLDIYVQDDTSVDYAILQLESCRCRPDIFVCRPPAANCAVVRFPTPTFTDLCCPNQPGMLKISCVPASGTCFPIGTNTVHCTAIDVAGRRARCCFRVIVSLSNGPVITSQPIDVIAPIGGSASFTVGASGPPILTYQWYFNGTALAGATSPTFTRNPVQASHEGSYFVVVANGCGSVTSDVPHLRIGGCCTNNMVAGYNLISCPYEIGGNTLNEVLLSVPAGSRIYKFDNASQTWQVSVFNGTSWVPNLTLNPGEGAFLQAPAAFQLVLCGARRAPVLPINIPPGKCYLLSRQSDDPGTYDNIVGTPPPDGATLFTWNPATQSYEAYQYIAGLGWDPQDPIVKPCSAAWICPDGAGNIPPPPQQPTITGVTPGTGQPGCLITITGTGFGQNPDNVCAVVMSGGQIFPLQVVEVSDAQLRVRLNGLPPGTPVTGRIAVATGEGQQLGIIDIGWDPPEFASLIDPRPADGSPGYVGPCDADPVLTDIGPTVLAGGALLQPAWVFRTFNPAVLSPGTITLTPPPQPGPGTNWVFARPATNCAVTFIISNDCLALTKVFVQGDLAVTSPNGTGLDIILPNLIIKTRLPAVACAQAICDLLTGAYSQVGITIQCTVTKIGANAAQITINVPGGCINSAGVMLCFTPAEAGRPDPIITGVDPVSGGPGDIVTITGSGFGNNPDDLCLQIMNGSRTIWMRALTAEDDRITAEIGSVPVDAVPGNIGLVRGFGHPQLITDHSNVVVNPIPAWGFASTKPGIRSVEIFTPIPRAEPPPATGQPVKKKFVSQPVNSDGTMCIFVDPDCDPNTKISIHAHFDLRDIDPNDGLDCPITHIDTAIDGTWWHSQLYTGSPTGGNCIDFVCQYLTQIFYDEYNAQFGQCYGYPISCSGDPVTGKITLNAECGCKLVSGVVEVEYCIPPQGGMPGPVITSINPPIFTSGQTIFLTGANFLGGMPDDHCVVLINSNRLIPLRAVAATPTMLTVEVGPIPPDAQSGQIGLALGDGSTGEFRPAFFDIFTEPAWFFAGTNGGVKSGLTVTPTYTPPPPQETWYHSFLSNGQVYVYLPGPCPPGTKLIMDGHFDIRSPNSPIRHADCWLPAVSYLQGGSAIDCARRICDSFVCGFLQRTGVRLGCQVIPVGNGALVCIGYPGGTIANGGMTVCTRICNQPPVAQCVTNSFYTFIRGTTNDNFAGPEGASPRPELVTYLNGTGVTTLRGYDDANTVVNRVFAESFGNLPDCITKATLRIRLRANKDIEINDSISLVFAGAGGVLDPDRWGAYIGSGNAGASVLNTQWISPSAAELVLDLSRLPLGGNMYKDLIPTLCNKRYLDIVLQDDTSVDYAVLTLESCRCRPDIVACSQPGLNGAVVTYARPVFTDQCCPGMSNALNVVCTPASGAVFPVGTSYVRCTATDVQGRRARCCFAVNVLPSSPPSVCPNASTITYTAGTTNDNFAGPEPSVLTSGLLKRLNMAGIGCVKGFDNCAVNCFFAHVFTNLPPCITEATLRIRIMACGDISRNDTIGISYTLPSGALGFGGWGRYIGSGNSGPGLLNTPWSPGSVQEFTFDLSALPTASGGTMDLIPSLAQWGAFEVIVQDDSAVDFVELRVKSCCCRQDIVVNTSSNQCCMVVNYPLPQFSDSCGNTNFLVSCNPPPTNCFPVGTNLVECRVANATGGLAGRCFFKVIVRDSVPPVIISCPTNIIACSGASNNVGVMPDLTAQVVATDNCTPSSQLVITQSPPPGSNVSGGTPGPTVVFFVTDAAGNSNFCVRPITIQPCCVQPPSGLALWLPFDELAGPRAINAAGGNNGTLLNGVVRDSSGYVGRELCFDGVDDAVIVANYPAINLGTNDLTIDAWVKRDAQSPNSPPSIIVDKRDPTNGVGYSLSLSFGRLVFQLADGGGFSNFADGVGLVPADNQWHFVAVTVCRYLTNGGRFYVDGVPGTIFNPTGRPGNINNNGSLYVGRSLIGGNRPWIGCIDEVEVFRRCLTTSEVTSLYNARYLGKCRSRCIVPWDTPICRGQTSVVVTATICNPSPVAQTYSFNWLGLPPGPGCSYPGPTSFSPLAGAITVAPNSCTNLPVIVGAPAGMPCGAIACYQLIIVPGGTNKQQFSCEGSLYMSCQVCARPPVLRTNIIVGINTSLGGFTIANSTARPLDLTGARLSAWGPDMQPDTRVIGLNGLPPGVPWEVPPGLILPPGGGTPFGPVKKDMGSVSIPVEVLFMDYDPGQAYTILLEADVDGDGQFEPLSSLQVENVILPEARLIITANPDHTVTLTWPEDYTLQQSNDLGTANGWSAAPVQASPYTFNPAGVSKRFYRLFQP